MDVSKFGRWWLLAACGWAGLAGLGAGADTRGVLQQANAWARFNAGAWRHVRIVTESFDEQGTVTNSSTTDNIATLEEVTPDHVTLKVEVTVEIAGQTFPSQPQIIQQGYAGETAGQTVSIKPLDGELLTVDGREIPCEAGQIEILGGGNKEVIQISYSPRMTPTILKRKSTTSDTNSGHTMQEALTEVYALDKRLKVLDDPVEKTGYRLRQVVKSDRGTTTTWSVNVRDVPGEVVTHSSQKFDEQGRLLRRSTLELVAYGVSADDVHRDSARRARRHKRGRS